MKKLTFDIRYAIYGFILGLVLNDIFGTFGYPFTNLPQFANVAILAVLVYPIIYILDYKLIKKS